MADTDRQKKFYTNQRVQAEEAADEGDVRARGTVDKINAKLGRGPREYTDADAVNKEALASVAPDAGEGLLAAKGLGMLGRFGKGLVAKGLEKKAASTAKKAASKGYESMEETAMKKAPSKVARSTTDRRATPRGGGRRMSDEDMKAMDRDMIGKSETGSGKVEPVERKASGTRKLTGSTSKGRVDRISDANKPGQKINAGKKNAGKGKKAPDFTESRKAKDITEEDKARIDKTSRDVPAAKPKPPRKPRTKKPPAEKPAEKPPRTKTKPVEKAPEPPARKAQGKVSMSGKKAVKGSEKRNATGDYAGSKTRIAKRPVMSQRTMAARDRMKKELAARKAKKK